MKKGYEMIKTGGVTYHTRKGDPITMKDSRLIDRERMEGGNIIMRGESTKE